MENNSLNPNGGIGTDVEEKTFTQEEVNKIVQNRLYKENEKLQNKIEELNQRELKADCIDYLRQENIQDYSIVDILAYNDAEDFKNKFNSIREYFNSIKSDDKFPQFTAHIPISSNGFPPNPIQDAFKHPDLK